MFAVCLLILVAGAAAIAAVTMRGASDSSRRPVVPVQPNAARRTYALLLGISQHGSVLGARDAPVTLQFFGDLQCKDSRQVMLGALPFLIRHWVRDGELRIRFRSTETDTHNAGGYPEFLEQQAAALAAGKQDKLWNFIDAFYREQGPEFTGYVDEAFLDHVAATAGIEMARWEEDWEPDDWVKQLKRDEQVARLTGVNTTPEFLIGPTGGDPRLLRHIALESPQVFDEAIEELLS